MSLMSFAERAINSVPMFANLRELNDSTGKTAETASPALRNDPGTVTIPKYRFNKNKATHTQHADQRRNDN